MNDHSDINGLPEQTPYDEPDAGQDENLPAGPHNLEAEQALIGALLINNDVYSNVAPFLTPEHFWEPIHSQIYQVACQCIEQGQPINPITIHHHFADHQGLKELGGMAYFAQLAAACPAVVTAPDYARIIFELANRRRVLDVSDQLRSRATIAAIAATTRARSMRRTTT